MPSPFPELQKYDPSVPREQPQREGWFADLAREERARQLREGVIQAPPPDTVARTTSLARQTGEAPLYIEGREDEYERALQASNIVELSDQYPVIDRFFFNNPRIAAAAVDDTESLGFFGSAWDTLKKLPETGAASFYGIGSQGAKINYGIADTLGALGDTLSSFATPGQMTRGELQDRKTARDAYWRGGVENAEQSVAEARPEYTGYVQRNILQGIENIPQSGIAILAGIATKNPNVAAGLMATQTGAVGYGEARLQGVDRLSALNYGVQTGAAEGLTELMPASFLVSAIAKRTPFGKTLIQQLGTEIPGEQVATALQDFSEWVILNPEATLGDYISARPEAALSTLLQTTSATTAQTSLIVATDRTVRAAQNLSNRASQAAGARWLNQSLDRMVKGVEQSKLGQRDPEALRELLREQARETGAENVFIPGESIKDFFQSDRFDPDANPFSEINWQEADAIGGDVVMPIEDYLTDVVGSPAFDAVKDNVRLSPGGMSKLEADAFENAMDEVMGEISEEFAKRDKAEIADRTVRDQLVADVALMFGESFTSPVARQIAEVAVSRAQTRADRLGQPLTGSEFDNFSVKQVMPEGVAEAVKADTLDLVINSMREGGDANIGEGGTLLDFIKERGGINDSGGDLAAMGLPKSMIREFDADQGALSGISGAGNYGADTILRDAIDDGFFPELANVQNETGVSELDASVLLDAIAKELSGQTVHRTTRNDRIREAAAELRELLSSAGLDPDGMSDADVRAAVERMETEGGLGEGFDQSAQGRIVFDENKRIIELFQGRNLSTPLHELGHMWLEELSFDASLPDAPQQIKDDFETVKGWFAKSGHPIGKDGQIPVAAHELWARGTERYFMEGKSPTQALNRLFEAFRSWMVGIYKTVKQLKAPITPQIREVMDRMIATDQEIETARDKQMLEASEVFQQIAQMSGEELAVYQKQVKDANAQAHSSLLEKTMSVIRRREEKRYAGIRKEIKAEEAERLENEPLFRAMRLMLDEPISRDWIKEEFGEDAPNLMPKGKRWLHSKTGIDPTVIAELSGYRSASEMVAALMGIEKSHREAKKAGDKRSLKARLVDIATDKEFDHRYGDPLTDGTIEREALAAVHSEQQGELIATELRILARQVGQRPTPYRIARDWARGKVRSGIVMHEAMPAAIQRYTRNAARSGKAAQEAMVKGDAETAFKNKQFQMMNNALVAESKEAHDTVNAAVKRMDKVARAKTRKSVDQDYLEQAQALLEGVDLRKRSQVGLDRQGQWEAWAAQRGAEGHDVLTPGSFEATIGKTNWTRLSVENLLVLDEQIKQILHLGRLKQTLLDNNERRDRAELVAEASRNADDIGRKPPKGSFTDPSWWDDISSGVLSLDAALLKMEQVFDWLDRGDSNGVFNRVVFRPIAAAQDNARKMLEDYYTRLKEARDKVAPETLRRWAERVTIDLIDPETGTPAVFERKKLVAMALNWGNAGNRQRLADGYGWSQEGIERVLMQELNESEWNFVQDTWNILDGLWPEIEKMERAINGVAPERIEAIEIETPFGKLKGGYYPAVYDTSLDYSSEEQAGRKADLFSADYIRATTRSSATKARIAKVSRPLLLDIGVITRHVGEVVHDVTHREAVMQAHSFLTDRTVMRAVDDTLGREIRKQFTPWINHVANSWASERAGHEGWGKWLGKLRANVTMVGMGWRFTTMLTQIAGYTHSFEMVGERWVAPEIAKFAAQMSGSVGKVATFQGVEMPPMMAFAMERSKELPSRMNTLDRDIRRELDRMAAQSAAGQAFDKLSAAKQFAYHGIGYMDRLVSIPTWTGAYNKAISQGMSEEDAAYAGDKAVRLSQGAGAAKDLAAVSTGQGRYGKLLTFLTMFYSFVSTNYARQRNLGRDVARGDATLPRLMARAWWMLLVAPILPELLSGRGPDEDEDAGWWIFKLVTAQSLSAIPVVRDVWSPAWDGIAGNRGFDYRMSPAQGAGQSVVRVAKDIGRIADGKETKRATRNAMELVGYSTGLVPGQAASTTQFLVDVGSGDADPEGFAEWYEGLTKGRIKE